MFVYGNMINSIYDGELDMAIVECNIDGEWNTFNQQLILDHFPKLYGADRKFRHQRKLGSFTHMTFGDGNKVECTLVLAYLNTYDQLNETNNFSFEAFKHFIGLLEKYTLEITGKEYNKAKIGFLTLEELNGEKKLQVDSVIRKSKPNIHVYIDTRDNQAMKFHRLG